MRRVNPAIKSPPQVIDGRVPVVGAQPGVQFLHLFGLAIVIHIAQPENIRRLRYNHSIAVKHEARHEFKSLVKNKLSVGATVFVVVNQDADSVAGWTILDTGFGQEAAVIFPGVLAFLGFDSVAAVRIFRGFGDPKPPGRIPVHRNGFVDQRLRGDEADFEVWVELELGCFFFR